MWLFLASFFPSSSSLPDGKTFSLSIQGNLSPLNSAFSPQHPETHPLFPFLWASRVPRNKDRIGRHCLMLCLSLSMLALTVTSYSHLVSNAGPWRSQAWLFVLKKSFTRLCYSFFPLRWHGTPSPTLPPHSGSVGELSQPLAAFLLNRSCTSRGAEALDTGPQDSFLGIHQPLGSLLLWLSSLYKPREFLSSLRNKQDPRKTGSDWSRILICLWLRHEFTPWVTDGSGFWSSNAFYHKSFICALNFQNIF